MKSLFITITIPIILASCGSKEQKTTVAQTETPAPSPAQLTDAQKADGWRLLFDGQTKDGWQIFKSRKNNTWEVLDGTLHCKALQEGVTGVGDERSDIMTAEEFENFELAFDWKISAEGNSGVMYRATEEFEQPYYSGPEYQLIDDQGYPGELHDGQRTGDNYDMHIAENKVLKPVGDWNSSRIVVNGNHVEHWLNGTKVVEYELGSADWNKRKQASKWKDAIGYGLAKKGHIVLQDHGNEAWFRNVMIKTL
jgi:Domain of Unknown Function (DUF1080)